MVGKLDVTAIIFSPIAENLLANSKPIIISTTDKINAGDAIESIYFLINELVTKGA